MAKTVQPIAIELGIKGGEKLAALNSSFRDLSKQVKLSDADITQATKDIVKFATEAGNSEATINGQIKAFEGLRKQATMGGKAYVQLGKDIANLKSNLQGSTSAIDAKKKAILDLANSAGATSKQIQNAIDKLSALRAETKLDSTAFAAFGKDIEGLVAKLNLLDQQAEKAAKKAGLLAGGIRATPGSIRAQAQAFKEEAASIQLQIDEIDNLASKERTLKKNVEERLGLQERLNKLLRSEAQTGFLASVESGRKAVISAANAFNDADVSINSFNKRLQLLDDTFGKLPNTTAGFNQRLQELQKQFVNTIRDGGNYVSVALEIARVQREAAAATQGLGAALVRDLNTGVAARSSKNLREAIGQLQSEMNELDVQTAEGSRRYAENANQVRNLETQLRQLGDSYRHVSDMAQQAAAAQGVYANTATARNYLNRAMVRAQEAAGAQLAEAVRAGVAATPLMLPAAGGTTAPGTGALRSGMAQEYIPTESRIGGRLGETPGQPSRGMIGDVQAISARRSIGPQATEEQIDRARRAHISRGEAIRAETEAKEAAARVEQGLRKEIDLARKAYNGSINSTNNLRGAIDRYRSTLPSASEEFEQLTREIIDLDRKSEAVSRRMGRRRMSPMQMTQAAGAALSGGIFGGPEGFLGGAIGAIGGVGSAFAGAAIGAQVAGIRKQISAMTEYAAQIQKMQIALRELAGSQEEYNKAIDAASFATQNLNVPQDVATESMTKLLAAVKGAGGGVNDAQLAFVNFTAAIKAAGGSAEQVEGVMTALVQIFSKGKVSAEEINQIAERLPGAFNLFAEAAGKTGPQLIKGLEEGSIGLNELMSLVVMLGERNLETALKISASSEEAGARLRVAYMDAMKDIGAEFQGVGAEFQDSFTKLIVENKDIIVSWARSTASSISVIAGVMSVLADNAARTIRAIIAFFTSLKDQAQAAIKKITDAWNAMTSFIANAFSSAAKAVGVDLGALSEFARNVASFFEEIFEKAFDFVQDKWAQTVKNIITLSNPIGWIGKILGVDIGDAVVTALQAGLSAAGKKEKTEMPEQPEPSIFLGPTIEDKDKAARDAERRAEEIARLKRAYDLLFAKRQILTVDMQLLDAARFIDQAQKENNAEAVDALRRKQSDLAFEKDLLAAKIEYDGTAREIKETLDGQQRTIAESTAQEQLRQSINVALGEQLSRILTIEQDITDEKKKQRQAIEAELTDRKKALGLISEDEYNAALMERESRRLREQFPRATEGQRAEMLDLYRQQIDPTPFELLQQNISRLKKELKELVDPVNQITGAANAIGTSFADSFKSVISGSATAQEALAGFFRNIANYFLDMAAQIIQKMIVMYVLNTLVGLLPGAQYGSGMGSKPGIPGSVSPQGLPYYGPAFAKGGIMTEDGPMPLRTYARGGIARSPQLAMFGEGSMPEAYVPLPDGRSIPVTMRGSAGVQVDAINITIENTGDQLTPAAQKQLAGQVQGIVLSTLANERRSGGML